MMRNNPIATLSIGATRMFSLKGDHKFKEVRNTEYRISLPSRSLLTMHDNVNTNFFHSILKKNHLDGRVSITFRKMENPKKLPLPKFDINAIKNYINSIESKIDSFKKLYLEIRTMLNTSQQMVEAYQQVPQSSSHHLPSHRSSLFFFSSL